MAPTVTDAWDGRGAGLLSAKLVPTFSEDPQTFIVDTSAGGGAAATSISTGIQLSAGAYLKFLIPSRLRQGSGDNFWYMLSYTQDGAIADGAYPHYFGTDTDEGGGYRFTRLAAGGDYFAAKRSLTTYPNSTFVQSDGTSWATGESQVVTIAQTITDARLYKNATLVGGCVSSGPTTALSTLAGNFFVGPGGGITMQWLILGTGDISTAKMAAIQANPNTYLYPSAAVVARRHARLVVASPRVVAAQRRMPAMMTGATLVAAPPLVQPDATSVSRRRRRMAVA